MNIQAIKQKLKFFLLILFIFSQILSFLYLAHEYDHHCESAHCFICLHSHQLEHQMKEVGGQAPIILMQLIFIPIIKIFCLQRLISLVSTPIHMKVRMNN